MRVITFKTREDLVEALDRYAAMHGMSRSEAIRMAIENMLHNSGTDKQDKDKNIDNYAQALTE